MFYKAMEKPDESRPAVVQKTKKPPLTILDIFLVAVISLIFFRVTVVAILALFVLLYALFPLHRSRRLLIATCVLLTAAILVPFDVYVRGFHGPIRGDKHSCPRFVRVVYGLAKVHQCLDEYGEFIAAGCCVPPQQTRWMLVLN
jgi:hypothetical protein